MNHPELIRRMYEVLDGEASEEEAQALDRILAADPAALAEYNRLLRLFDQLSQMPAP